MVIESLQAYVGAIRADHRHQGSLVHHVRDALATGARLNWNQSSVQQIITSLDALHQHLGHHFTREEEGGYLEEALVHAPRFQSRASQLMAEHPSLLEEFGTLTTAARNSAAEKGQWPTLTKKLNSLIDELIKHEVGENQLLQEAFAADLNLDE